MDVIYQLWGLHEKDTDWALVLERLDELQKAYPAKALVCGIQAPEDVYNRIIHRAHQNGTDVYLWLPVFSELDDSAVFDPLIDWNGRAFLNDQKPEGFHFRCPGSKHNQEQFYKNSLTFLQMGEFDGVFLDRIRYPSFQFGLSGVLSCFCPQCLRHYQRIGLDPETLISACNRLKTRIAVHEQDPLGLIGFDGHRWQFKDAGIQALFDARCTVLTDSLEQLCSAYRSQGYKIGFDLFTPSLAYFAGQDFDRLVPLADFVKPMLYLHTNAPAGIPYELDVIGEYIGKETEEMIMTSCGDKTIDDFAAGEISRINQRYNQDCSCGTSFYYGMEYNRVADIAPVGPDEISHTLKVFRKAGASGIMPAWSFLSSPGENIHALINELTAHG